MTPSESGAARMVLHRIGQQLDHGNTPEAALRNGHRMCDRLPLGDRLLPTLLVSWLAAGHKQGRDLGQMLSDAETLLDMVREAKP